MGKQRNGGRKIDGDTKWNEKRGSVEGREKERMREKMDREGRRRQRVDLRERETTVGRKGNHTDRESPGQGPGSACSAQLTAFSLMWDEEKFDLRKESGC